MGGLGGGLPGIRPHRRRRLRQCLGSSTRGLGSGEGTRLGRRRIRGHVGRVSRRLLSGSRGGSRHGIGGLVSRGAISRRHRRGRFPRLGHPFGPGRTSFKLLAGGLHRRLRLSHHLGRLRCEAIDRIFDLPGDGRDFRLLGDERVDVRTRLVAGGPALPPLRLGILSSPPWLDGLSRRLGDPAFRGGRTLRYFRRAGQFARFGRQRGPLRVGHGPSDLSGSRLQRISRGLDRRFRRLRRLGPGNFRRSIGSRRDPLLDGQWQLRPCVVAAGTVGALRGLFRDELGKPGCQPPLGLGSRLRLVS